MSTVFIMGSRIPIVAASVRRTVSAAIMPAVTGAMMPAAIMYTLGLTKNGH